jgi:hypothetical protein
MTTTEPKTYPGELTQEEFMAKVEAGIFYDRLDSFAPPEMYGPPTKAELAAAVRKRRKIGHDPAASKGVVAPRTKARRTERGK